jgi:hypothetical protein
MEEVIDALEDVWGDYNDFEVGGEEYVAFIISQDIADMEEADWDEYECVEELSDICINAMRMMVERGYDPQYEIIQRLIDHRQKGQEELIEKYQQMYEDGL